MRFSVAQLLWLLGGVAIFLGFVVSSRFTGVIQFVSLLFVVLLWRTAPAGMWFQKTLVAAFGWSGGLLGWWLCSSLHGERWIGHDFWQAEADTVSSYGTGLLALSIAAYLVFHKRDRG